MIKVNFLILLLFFTATLILAGEKTQLMTFPASDPFYIPSEPPDTVITAMTLYLKGGTVELKGNVKAIRQNDVLTCGRAFVNKKNEWILATDSPRLYRKENLIEKKAIREITVDAQNIVWENLSGTFQASAGVVVTIEERTWDLATYTKIIINADEMIGYRETKQMKFSGNVRIQDEKRFGKGRRLDYDKASSTAILSGDAMVEEERWSAKEKKMVKHILTGETIIYNFDTKQASSE